MYQFIGVFVRDKFAHWLKSIGLEKKLCRIETDLTLSMLTSSPDLLTLSKDFIRTVNDAMLQLKCYSGIWLWGFGALELWSFGALELWSLLLCLLYHGRCCRLLQVYLSLNVLTCFVVEVSKLSVLASVLNLYCCCISALLHF